MMHYKCASKRRNYDFNLSEQQFKSLLFENCYYCGQSPSIKINYSIKNGVEKDVYYNGIDRLNNDIGYNVDNCVTCCQICNKAKGILSESDFMQWIDKLISYRKFKNENSSS
ncbi:MAG: hypothetical protein ACTSWD_02465 [Candidatus Heimdallarchaeota archaeon]